MQYLLELTEKKSLTKYYYVSKEGTIYKINNRSNGCDDAKQMTDEDPVKITVTYKKSDNTTYNTYLYMDSYIEVGDYWDATKHEIKPHSCPNVTYSSLADKYKADVVEYNIKRMVERGLSKDSIVSSFPKYFLYNGSEVKVSDTITITSVIPQVYINVAKFDEEVEKYAKQEAEESANKVLSVIDKKVDKLTMTTKAI